MVKKKINQTGDVSNALFLPPRDGMRRVQRGYFAYHCEGTLGYTLIAQMFKPHEICETKEIRFRKNRDIGLITRKFSPFRDHKSTFWNWMRETGVFSKHKRHWILSKPTCMSNAIVMSVGFDYVGSFFIFLLFAYAIAMIILAAEIGYYRFVNHNGNKHRLAQLQSKRMQINRRMLKKILKSNK